MKNSQNQFVKKGILALSLAAACVLLVLLTNSEWISEYVFSRGITRFLSFLLNRITNFLPVSLYEVIVISGVILAIVAIVFLITCFCKKQPKRALSLLLTLANAALCVVIAFFTLFGFTYHRLPLDTQLNLPDVAVNKQTLGAALDFNIEKLNGLSSKFSRDATGNIIAPLSFGEIGEGLNAEFNRLENDYFHPYSVKPKKVLLSVPMTYLGITGIYFPFTAESNVNTNTASYDFPCLIAHEMSHAKGIAHENEANFLAYYLCILSEKPYFQYAGYMNATRNLLNAMYATDKDAYTGYRAKLSPEILREWRNESEHYAKYDSVIDKISTFFNNLFLKSNGVPSGVLSYSQTTESLVALASVQLSAL